MLIKFILLFTDQIKKSSLFDFLITDRKATLKVKTNLYHVVRHQFSLSGVRNMYVLPETRPFGYIQVILTNGKCST